MSPRPDTDPDVAQLSERLEWLHYQGSKSFPHTKGDCELCDAVEEVRAGVTALAARLDAAEARLRETRDKVDRQLGRHLCYTSTSARERFWKQVDAALAADEEGT
jgi:hypothetical protein